jgi:hypothetical protein
MSTGVTPVLLAALWREWRPSGPPVAHTFRTSYADHWVHFHSLPVTMGWSATPTGPDAYPSPP